MAESDAAKGAPKLNTKLLRGLAQHKLTDHYAILGIPITASGDLVRRKFLQLAKVLHPDIFGRTPAERDLGTQYLAKMINPAYQLLSNDRNRAEYLASLRLFAKLQRQKNLVPDVISPRAQQLQRIPHEFNYHKFIDQAAAEQYQSLDSILPATEELSELNLIFLLTQNDLSAINSRAATPAAKEHDSIGQTTIAQTGATPAKSAKSDDDVTVLQSPTTRLVQLAQLYVNKKQWADALKELRNAEKLEPEQATIHGLLGVVYMNQNNNVMAKASFQKAQRLNPREPNALKYLKQVEAALAAPPPKKGGGLFGFGKK
ncbi:MAG: DnaJ domain-containing protein [Oscillatoriales cyanobacterium SM2_2_1]|nr:DnaJ domain-containing protein [Oscillatoriales cyanobacterium SM2_2_1]